MRRRSLLFMVTVMLSVSLAFPSIAQKPKATKIVKKPAPQKAVKTPTNPTPNNDSQDEKQVRDMIAFLEFVLNTLGNSTTLSRDKDVLITQSYAKIFRDANVQIEDDLDETREIVTNKSVVAYLKDVDFFFTDVHFEFVIDQIQKGETSTHSIYYKISLKRNLKGTTSDGLAVNNTQPRFIEINYDPVAQDLKIASIYTHEIDERGALLSWWKQLSLEWQTIFKSRLASGKDLTLGDSLGYTDIQDILAFTSLDLSSDHYLQTIKPLGKLANLRILNLSRTGINDLSPLRNLTSLTELDISNSSATDLTSLRYCDKLVKLNISHTLVVDISVLEKMPGLQFLNISRTKVTDFQTLAVLENLTHLDISGTGANDISFSNKLTRLTDFNLSSTQANSLQAVAGISSLTTLNVDSTRITSLAPLSKLENLTSLYANHTSASDLSPLADLPHLTKVYADHSGINRIAADNFMANHPAVLVIVDTEDLQSWWTAMSQEWKVVLSSAAHVGATPTKEELAKVPGLDSINIEGMHITNLEPLDHLMNLRILLANRTTISDLSPLKGLGSIQVLDISETEVTDLSVLEQFTKLTTLRADKTKLENLHSLYRIKSLRSLYVDQTAIHDITAREFLEKNPGCLLVYKTIHLNRWWSRLPNGWKVVFQKQMGSDSTATRENLHHLAELEKFEFSDSPVSDLNAFSEFIRLQSLHFEATSIADLSPLVKLNQLNSLRATNSPIATVEPLRALTTLRDLDISNTSVDDLKPLEALSGLRELNCAGTQIKKLDPLKNLPLESFDCSNTRVSNLSPIENHSLKSLKCFNSKVSAREIESFKKQNPDCRVTFYR